VETQNRLADTPVDPPTPEVPKPEPKSKTMKKKHDMDTEEYVGNDKLTGPPIRVTHSDHTADLIQVVREKDKHTNKQTKVLILESTAPPQLRISH
jgi:hypothetical protein